ncbi:NitT/TauT family transport system substrate-binding protein [Collimonas sp. OK607]|uniref:ABC transporter substrate-binding protein n=1 Tax=Collimonas sp. OK607 TaxID=1798194 RepID=UPI0008E4DE0D|nr:ABC transporter substrate-binding protein [Collimonas sp. OK607]SFB36530.1 NitT/TauT family transport system substrate-binding protein [Collimonas sp. OK607]
MLKTILKSVLTATVLSMTCGTTFAVEPEKQDISMAVGSSILGYTPVPLAQNLGFLKAEGLNVTFENFQAGGSKALQALIGGSVDVVIGSYDHTIQMQAKGKEIVGVFLLNEVPGITLEVRADLADKVKSGKDLKGLRLGITTPGSSTDMIARYYVKKSGLAESDVKIIGVGSGAPGMVALTAKNVDALFSYDPVSTQLLRKGEAKLLFDARTVEGSKLAFGGPYPFACVYVTRSFLEKNPETVQRIANAFLRTVRWIAASTPQKIVETLPATSKLGDAELNAAIWAASKGMFSTTGLFNAEDVKTPLAVLSGFDPSIANKKIDLSKTYTNRFAEAAAQRVK